MKKIALKYGFRMLAGFLTLFLLVHFLGLSQHYHLRILNGFIHFACIYYAIRDYRRQFPDSLDNYVSGVAVGMYASIIGVALFGLAMCIFLSLNVNQSFFEALRAKAPLPEYFTPFTATLFILTEGIVVGLIGSYLVTRWVDDRLEKARDTRS